MANIVLQYHILKKGNYYLPDSIVHLLLNQNRDVIQSKLSNGDALKVDLLNIQASIDNEINRKVDIRE
jgi:hypothetical protein